VKVLVTRTDRLGDLVLSLPALRLIKERRPDWSLHVLVAPGSVPLVENEAVVDRVWTWVPGDTCVRRDLLRAFRREKFEAALMLQFNHELATLLKKAHIPRRHGPLSKFSSWYLLNRGQLQNRSRCRRHEMQYNLELAARLTGGGPWSGETEPRLNLAEGQYELGREFRREQAAGAEVVAFVHPGSGGSALDWEPERFAGVAGSLAALPGFRVFITGSGGDSALIDPMLPLLDSRVEVLLDRYELREFLGVLTAGDLFIGPSTGPLHMAAALGLAVVGLYPPVRTMAPGRWGPRGGLARAVVPPVDCPEGRFCRREKCEFFNCLDRVFERDVLDIALALLKQKQEQDAQHKMRKESE
jgi:heptosyltransferase-3